MVKQFLNINRWWYFKQQQKFIRSIRGKLKQNYILVLYYWYMLYLYARGKRDVANSIRPQGDSITTFTTPLTPAHHHRQLEISICVQFFRLAGFWRFDNNARGFVSECNNILLSV